MKRFMIIAVVLFVSFSSASCVKVVKTINVSAEGVREEHTEVQVGALPPPCVCGYVHYHWNEWYGCNRGGYYSRSYYPYRRVERRVIGVVHVDVHH